MLCMVFMLLKAKKLSHSNAESISTYPSLRQILTLRRALFIKDGLGFTGWVPFTAEKLGPAVDGKTALVIYIVSNSWAPYSFCTGITNWIKNVTVCGVELTLNYRMKLCLRVTAIIHCFSICIERMHRLLVLYLSFALLLNFPQVLIRSGPYR